MYAAYIARIMASEPVTTMKTVPFRRYRQNHLHLVEFIACTQHTLCVSLEVMTHGFWILQRHGKRYIGQSPAHFQRTNQKSLVTGSLPCAVQSVATSIDGWFYFCLSQGLEFEPLEVHARF